MPLNSNALKFVIGGHIGTSQTWSTALWINAGTPGTNISQTELDAVRDQLAPLASTWATSVASRVWSNDTQMDNVKLYFYPDTGTHSTAVSQKTVTPVVGSAANYLPSFVSMVCTTRSSTPGRSGRGRSYLPCTSAALTNAHKFGTTDANTIGGAYKTLLQAINALTFAGPVLVNDKVSVASFSKGLLYLVTSITIDDNPDTQHRREDKIGIAQLYSSAI